MKLQLALDTPDLRNELELAIKTAAHVDMIEAGTPLLIREGIRAVRELRRRFRGLPIVADIKVIDAGEPIAELAFAAGANIVTVLGCASNEVVKRVVASAKRYDGRVMVDSLGMSDIAKRSRQLADLGVDSICVNRRGFGVALNQDEQFEMLSNVIHQIELPVYLAGGIYLPELNQLKDLPLEGVIIGAAIAQSQDPVATIKRIRLILESKKV